MTLSPDIDAAARFVAALGGERQHFQTFDDDHNRKLGGLVYSGTASLATIAPMLQNRNSAGAGVFVACQDTKGLPRKVVNIPEARSIMADFDDGLPIFSLEPTAIVKTSSPKGFDRYQAHWLFSVGEVLSPQAYAGIMRRMVTDYGADPNACDLARCGRLPGFYHMKDSTRPHLVRVVGGSRRRMKTEAILAAYPPIDLPPRPTAKLQPLQFADRYIAAAVAGVIAELATAPNGQRNRILNRCAFRLGQLGFDLPSTLQLVLPTALSLGLPFAEIEKTTISGRMAGAQNAGSV